jgi:HEPN domain-containing protein
MLTSIPHLAINQQEQLAQLIQGIDCAIQPEKIICYGSRITIMQDWGCFLDHGEYKESIHPTFDLLIIIKDEEKRAEHEIIQIAEQQCKPPVSLTCIAHKLNAVNDALSVGSHFFSFLFQKGVLIQDTGQATLHSPHESFTGWFAKNKAESYWSRWYGLAQRFSSLAAHAVSSGWPDQAVFLLHQAVEHTCIALIRVFTGYRSNTHNLSRLLALSENFSLLPSSIFPRITKEETELFNLLLRGYSDTRYKYVYTTTMETVAILIDRVKELQAVAESLYKERISMYGKKEDISFPLLVNAGNE